VIGRRYPGAAEECAVSQPALSIQIYEFENELGAKLIVPQQRATAVTEIGPASTLRRQRGSKNNSSSALLAEANLKLGRPVEGLH
jgi:DNA-binding transcriptional LysR family regulator